MRVILGEGAHTHDAMQRAGWLIALAGTELRHAQRQFPVASQALVEDLHVAGAVHRLEGEHAVMLRLILDMGGEHVLAEFLPVAGGLPKLAVHQLRRAHLLVVGRVQAAAHIGLDRAVQHPSLGVPEDAADRFLLQMEQPHFLADAAMVALLRLLDLQQVRVQLLLVAPGGAVDAAEHGVAVVAPPIGAGHLLQLEGRTHVSGAAHVRRMPRGLAQPSRSKSCP